MPGHSKDIVFLSHSSADKKALNILRDLLIQKTGGSIDFFLSSDGQSIPFGRNWVHSVEQALTACKIMFVFATPSSLRSSWIHFEAGYAYSKGIRVVPVGALGVDLGATPPPLGLLQGFNISAAAGLNNIIATINEEFAHRHAESFAEFDYRAIFEENVGGPDAAIGTFSDFIHSISTGIANVDGLDLSVVEDYLRERSIAFISGEHRIEGFGFSMVLRAVRIPGGGDATADHLLFDIGLELLSANLQMIFDLAERYSQDEEKKIKLMIRFDEAIRLCGPHHQRTARLFGTEVGLLPKHMLQFRGIEFTLDSTANIKPMRNYRYINVAGAKDSLTPENVSDLIQLLLDRNVLIVETEYFV